MPRDEQVVDIQALETRAKGIKNWLKGQGGQCFDEQKHLDTGTQERVYWHFGYMVALRDVLRLLTGKSSPMADTFRVDTEN